MSGARRASVVVHAQNSDSHTAQPVSPEKNTEDKAKNAGEEAVRFAASKDAGGA